MNFANSTRFLHFSPINALRKVRRDHFVRSNIQKASYTYIAYQNVVQIAYFGWWFKLRLSKQHVWLWHCAFYGINDDIHGKKRVWIRRENKGIGKKNWRIMLTMTVEHLLPHLQFSKQKSIQFFALNSVWPVKERFHSSYIHLTCTPFTLTQAKEIVHLNAMLLDKEMTHGKCVCTKEPSIKSIAPKDITDK